MVHRNFSSRLNSYITFLKKEHPAKDQWKEVYSCFTEIRALANYKPYMMQSVLFGNIIVEGYYIFTIRFTSQVSLGMRIKFENRNFDIRRVINPLEKKYQLEIITLETQSKI